MHIYIYIEKHIHIHTYLCVHMWLTCPSENSKQDGNPIYISGNVAYKILSAKKATVDTASPDKYTNEMAPMALRTVASKSHYNDLRGESTSQMLAEEQPSKLRHSLS